jgi:inorganic pyrophosphatase
MLIAAQSSQLSASRQAMVLPLLIYAGGLVVCVLVSFVATHLTMVTRKAQIERTLKTQVMLSTLLMTPAIYFLCISSLPDSFHVKSIDEPVHSWHIAVCLWSGLWCGLIMGSVTEYYTSSDHPPVRELATANLTGAATNVIYGLSLGYKSVVAPVITITLGIVCNFALAGEYGVAMGAVGILSTLATELAIDAYGPICDNAGGIAEMAMFPEHVSKILDDLDAAGNTTAAVGKGFAIGSATCVSLALFGAFVTNAGLENIEIQDNLTFAGLLAGAMLPYWFTAMTMKSVGLAAKEMVEEVRRQMPDITSGAKEPDYDRCIEISTESSLHEMIRPAFMTVLTPLFVGFFISPRCLAGLLAGNLISGVQMAISQSNTGGAWDNAKKYIEAGNLVDASGAVQGKKTPAHDAAVIGDTVGDPMKDTSGPAINILIKVTAILSVVFAPAMPDDGLLVRLFHAIRGA